LTTPRGDAREPGTARGRTVLQGGRAKAYRPLAAADRASAARAGIEAYERGDFFEAHELLEPAWMGTDDPAERELVQGLIKLAAAFVHAARSNPLGVRKNLVGSRDRLATSLSLVPRGDLPGPLADVDGDALLRAIEDLLSKPVEAPVSPPPLARRGRER
jgi:predicted metal-dependent hydrolase